MALSELQRKQFEPEMGNLLEKRRPPAHIRPKLDIGVRVTGQSVEIYEVRPRWDQPQEKRETPVAKATYVKAKDLWRVFWMRQDLKWHRYDPKPVVSSLEAFGKLVHEDKYGCFFG
jgi:hypothetical protein